MNKRSRKLGFNKIICSKSEHLSYDFISSISHLKELKELIK